MTFSRLQGVPDTRMPGAEPSPERRSAAGSTMASPLLDRAWDWERDRCAKLHFGFLALEPVHDLLLSPVCSSRRLPSSLR